jgi:hypothetical protein
MDMRGTNVLLVAVTALLLSCSEPTTAAAPHVSSPPPTPSPTPTVAPLAKPVRLPALPQRGFVTGARKGVTFRDEAGTVLLELKGYELLGNSGAPGVWFKGARRTYFRLAVAKRRLVPVAAKVARDVAYDEGPEPDLPTPPVKRVNGRIPGRWRFMLPSPDGDVSLAQWSGECEVPTAYWIERGATPRAVVDRGGLVSSVALGWATDGRALVHAEYGHCGGSGNPPGVYAFSAPLEGELIFRTGPFTSVKMWRRA